MTTEARQPLQPFQLIRLFAFFKRVNAFSFSSFFRTSNAGADYLYSNSSEPEGESSEYEYQREEQNPLRDNSAQ